MNAYLRCVPLLFAGFFLLGFTGPSHAEPENLTLLIKKLQVYHDSFAYEKDIADVARKARHYIIARAKANAADAHPKKLALILDIDETSLSNYKHIVAQHFCNDTQRIDHDIALANDPAIRPLLALYQNAKQQGVSVFFITGRRESLRAATVKNLHLAGYDHWSGLYLKPNDEHLPSIIPFKSRTRASISRQGYTIIASIGDQSSDLKGGFTEKGFKLPNPFYYLN